MRIRSQRYIALLYILSPLLSLFLIIRRYDLRENRWLVYWIAAFVGFTLNFSMEEVDGFRHTQDFLEATKMSWGDFLRQLQIIVERSTATVDYYVTVINFLVSRFFSNPSFVFAVHALVFTFFYLKVINLAYDEFGGEYRVQQLFLFGLVFLFPVTQINALRYPIALWIWSYGALYYLKTGYLKYLLTTASASLVHFGITPATAVLMLFHLAGSRTKLYFFFFVASFFFFNLISFEEIVSFTEGLGSGIQGRVDDYFGEQYLERRSKELNSVNWYVIWRYKLLNWFTIFGVFFLYFSRNKVRVDVFQKTLIAFILLYAGYINLVIDIPSFGGRQRWFLWIIVLFALYRSVSMNTNSLKVKRVAYLGVVPILLYSLVEIRTMFFYLSLDSLLSNPLLVLIEQSELTLDQIIKR